MKIICEQMPKCKIAHCTSAFGQGRRNENAELDWEETVRIDSKKKK